MKSVAGIIACTDDDALVRAAIAASAANLFRFTKSGK